MFEIASLLPEDYHGYYAQIGNGHHRHLEYIDLTV